MLRGIGNHASSNWQQCITIRNVEFNGVLEDAVHFNDETGKNNQLVLEGGIMNQIGRNQVYCSK